MTIRRRRPLGARVVAVRGGRDLLGEVGDPDPVRAAGLDPGLDGGADVVDVHVDVPQALVADHDQGVPERAERGAQGRDPLLVGVEEVHHLVGRAVRA